MTERKKESSSKIPKSAGIFSVLMDPYSQPVGSTNWGRFDFYDERSLVRSMSDSTGNDIQSTQEKYTKLPDISTDWKTFFLIQSQKPREPSLN
jgi:hypothetical protein